MGGKRNFEDGNDSRVERGNNPHKRIQYGKITIERLKYTEAVHIIGV